MPFIIFYRLTLQTQTKTQKEKQEKITEKNNPDLSSVGVDSVQIQK